MKHNFFVDLPGFTDFSELAKDTHYIEAPADWLVVITDVQGSTKAIQEGRYKTVNMAGASTLAAVVNAVGSKEIPFVFGGDGATAQIPPEAEAKVRQALNHSREISQREHNLSLRVGIVPHAELLKAQAPVRVAKYRLQTGFDLAFFKGRGLEIAEEWVKGGRYILEKSEARLDFDPHQGLSCRWAPLGNTRGLFLSILVKIHSNKVESFDGFVRDLLKSLDQILDLNSPEAHPVKTQKLTGEKSWKAARIEAAFQSGSPLWKRILKILSLISFVKALDKGWLSPKLFDVTAYKKSLVSHSDFRKFDETLRMVVDCTPQMKKDLQVLLEDLHQKGFLSYGLHESETALMTCFVQKLEEGQHVHFIDGGDGGYAMAARGLKEQLKKNK